MKLLSIDTQPSRRQLTQFCLAWVVFFCVVAALAFARWDSPRLAGGLAALAVALPLVGAIHPQCRRWTYLGLAYAAYPLGWLVSHLLLLALYFLIITPIGLVVRMAKRDFFPKKFDHEATSYWKPKQNSRSLQDYFKRF